MKVTFSLKHVLRITDNIGIAEHCIFAKPNRKEGYSVDDNARALLACLKIDGEEKETAQQLIPTYLKFLIRALDKKGFHQDLNQDLTWENDAGVEEGFGRAMVALGETSLSALQNSQKFTAASIFDQQAFLIPDTKHPRVIAQTIIAISKRIKFNEKRKPFDFKKELIILSDKLIKDYREHSSKSWKWYENVISYDNGRLPFSLFCAFQVTKDQIYLKVAKESLDFLIEQTYDNSKNYFSFVGNKGWYPKGKKPAIFDQQPIEAGSTVEVCCLAYKITKEKKYLDWAKKALDWYYGKNILGAKMIDQDTGGIYDGLEEKEVNLNQGAESVLSYILAYLALKEIE